MDILEMKGEEILDIAEAQRDARRRAAKAIETLVFPAELSDLAEDRGWPFTAARDLLLAHESLSHKDRRHKLPKRMTRADWMALAEKCLPHVGVKP